MQEAIITALTIILPLVLGWFFGRGKTKAETKGLEIENELKLQEARLKTKSEELEIMSKNAAYYQQMVDDFAERYTKVLDDLKQAHDAAKEREQKIDELLKTIKARDIQIQELIGEIRKYKQLNGKVE